MAKELPIQRVFFVSVGNMPASKAENYVQKFKDAVPKRSYYDDIFIATKGESSVQYYDPN